MSQLTTHILDTMTGHPAAAITAILYSGEQDEWTEVTRGITNSDGRIPGLLPEGTLLAPGVYRMRFETKDYFDKTQTPTFYPFVEITFEINSATHYHIPLLLSPFGFSTYRGS